MIASRFVMFARTFAGSSLHTNTAYRWPSSYER